MATTLNPGILVMSGSRIGIMVKHLDPGRVIVQFGGPLPEVCLLKDLTLLSVEIEHALNQDREPEYVRGVDMAKARLRDLGLL